MGNYLTVNYVNGSDAVIFSIEKSCFPQSFHSFCGWNRPAILGEIPGFSHINRPYEYYWI